MYKNAYEKSSQQISDEILKKLPDWYVQLRELLTHDEQSEEREETNKEEYWS